MNLLCNYQKPVLDGWSTKNRISKGKPDSMADEFGSLFFSKILNGRLACALLKQQSTNSQFEDIFMLSVRET